jgi:hypothetical protein
MKPAKELRLIPMRRWEVIRVSHLDGSSRRDADAGNVLRSHARDSAERTLRAQRSIQLATHEAHVLADPQARQTPVAGVLQHRLRRDPAEKLTDLSRS